MDAVRGSPDLEQYILDHFDEALQHDYIKVYVQPVLRTLTRQYCGMESLARWEDPDRGLLMPQDFIPVLEKHRRIHELDIRVLNRICETYGSMSSRISVPVSINFSRLDYELCDIFNIVEETVHAHKVPRGNLCIEITESVLASNEELMRQHIERFRSAGYAVWMDDFGSGYSSLNILKDFIFDELKIDMRFLSDSSNRSRLIVASVVNMAKQIGIQTLAEGVETEDQYEFLHNIGCEKVQGFLFGKPMPFEECMKYVEESGLKWEEPGLRWYYDEAGRVNVLSARPTLNRIGNKTRITGRKLNGIAMTVAELKEQQVTTLFTNDAFDEIATAVEWPRPESRRSATEGVPMAELSHQLQKLLEEVRKKGESRLLCVYDSDYYVMQAHRLSQHGKSCVVLVSVDNLSRISFMVNQQQLDEGLRPLYSVYEQVSLVDLKQNLITSLYLDRVEYHRQSEGDIKSRVEAYCETRLFPDDRDRYRSFMAPETLEERAGRRGGISIHLRCMDYHGSYIWKCYLLVRIRKGVFYLLIREAEKEVRELQARYMNTTVTHGELTSELLWENAVNYADMKFFWKDTHRRFVGVSRSFLKYYGFKSEEELIGKTDEDMGWHIHNDPYRDEELKVLEEGMTSRKVKGNCLARGEDHEIIATKIPVFNHNGKIVGLMGSFYQSDAQITEKDAAIQARTDDMTGLLNSRGLYEVLFTYVDEYELRGRDFGRVEVSIDDLEDVNGRFGYDFGDAVIRETGLKLLARCGNKATIGRISGGNFTVLRQFTNPAAMDELVAAIRKISSEPFRINGGTFYVYLSVGQALYSETADYNAMAEQAEMRRLMDDTEHGSRARLIENTKHIFHAFDDLPMSYAAFRFVEGPEGKDAVLLYVNRMYSKRTGFTAEETVGRRVSELFAPVDARFWTMAEEAGKQRMTLQGKVKVEGLAEEIDMTAYPVIGPGFFACAFYIRR